MAILEAWATGLPTIMTEACHLPEGFSAGSALRCDTEPPDIAEVLVTALAKPEAEWLRMSDAAKGLTAGPYSREAVASRWATIYGNVMAGASNG